MSMTKISSSHLKANLGRYLRHVRAGKELVVTDRDVPVARLVPITCQGSADQTVPGSGNLIR
jgi:prevent-host-death family protein